MMDGNKLKERYVAAWGQGGAVKAELRSQEIFQKLEIKIHQTVKANTAAMCQKHLETRQRLPQIGSSLCAGLETRVIPRVKSSC